MQLLISVIIPAYRCAQYIKATIHSALQQTWENLEVIVIDDASPDDTYPLLEEIAKTDPRVQIFQNTENLGVAETRNRGFALAKGDYIALLDSDDLWEEEKLEKQMQRIEQTGCDFCYTGYTFIDAQGTPFSKERKVPDRIDFKKLLSNNVIGCSTILCRAELMKQYPMRGEYFHEDYVLWLELLQEGYAACGVTQPLAQYRLHTGNRSRNKQNAAAHRWRIYRDFLKMGRMASFRYFVSYALHGLRKAL